jgi:polyisoprenyl-phosphate glycosyltransferase
MEEDLPMSASEPQDRLVLLLPVFNDWEAVRMLLDGIDAALAGQPWRPEILIIDDGSTEAPPAGFPGRDYTTIAAVDILHLRRNLGHQRAIAVGLVYIHQHVSCRAVVVMDADGEDRPERIPALLDKFRQEGERRIVFAARAKRLETPLFRFLYHTYRLIHWTITGDAVRVGNFSVIPFQKLSQLVVVPEIWNHYAAAVIRTRLGFTTIPVDRGRRLTGSSKMNFIGLLLHGLSAFFVYGEVIGARLLVGIALLLLASGGAVAAGILLHFGRYWVVPPWSTYAVGAFVIVLLQALVLALLLVFTVIGSRVNVSFLPIRDCPYFVERVERVWPS